MIKNFKEQTDKLMDGCKTSLGIHYCGDYSKVLSKKVYCYKCEEKIKTLIEAGEYFLFFLKDRKQYLRELFEDEFEIAIKHIQESIIKLKKEMRQ